MYFTPLKSLHFGAFWAPFANIVVDLAFGKSTRAVTACGRRWCAPAMPKKKGPFGPWRSSMGYEMR